MKRKKRNAADAVNSLAEEVGLSAKNHTACAAETSYVGARPARKAPMSVLQRARMKTSGWRSLPPIAYSRPRRTRARNVCHRRPSLLLLRRYLDNLPRYQRVTMKTLTRRSAHNLSRSPLRARRLMSDNTVALSCGAKVALWLLSSRTASTCVFLVVEKLA